MGHLVHRVIERGDGRDNAQKRRTLRIDPALLAMVGQVATENLSIVLEHFLCAKQQHVAHSTRLVDGILHTQPGLGADQMGNVLESITGQCRCSVQNGSPLKSGQCRVIGMRLLIGPANFLKRGFGDSAQEFFRIRVEHLDAPITARPDFLPCQTHGVKLMITNKSCNIAHAS